MSIYSLTRLHYLCIPIYVCVESFFLGSAQQTEAFVRLRVAHKHLFAGGRDSATIQCCKINAQPIICNVCNFE